MATFGVANFRSAVTLATSRFSHEVNDDGGSSGCGIVMPPVKTDAGILARCAVVFWRALTDLDACRQRRRVRGCKHCCVHRCLQQPVTDNQFQSSNRKIFFQK